MHKVFNRFVSRMNYLSQYITSPIEKKDNDEMNDANDKPW